ncbi:hypothetical protein [Shinella zoogloeoides]|uniref:hypothetical protein n=1 Tax=Shinella zoogloeoides TaxID=352475 RepID=UPI00273DD13C|nr:hypothetical protein [Shinella zoogloeoides]WLR91019.1 hypothetical protein Q9316_00290 [Shinella zoogloeoides]
MIALPSKNTVILGVGAVLGAFAGIVLSSLVWIAYNQFVGYPAAAEEARQGYVVLSEKVALEAKVAIEQKRRETAEIISRKHAEALEKADALNNAEKSRLEQENAEYEARLEAVGRRCELDGADIDWLRKP